MSGYRGGRGRGGGGSATLKGSFINGVWYCDCNPPLPAVHFAVKKEGPNKGKWFRVCQKDQKDRTRCDFFLWDTSAGPRENAALSNNSRTEPGRASNATPSRIRPQRAISPPPPYTLEAGPSDSSRKRTRQHVQEDDDEYGFEVGSTAFDDELNQVMDAVETPTKRARTDPFTTPAKPTRRVLPWQQGTTSSVNGLHTPQTGHRNATEPGSSSLTPTGHKQADGTTPHTSTPTSSFAETPTPSRFRDAGTGVTENDLARDVFGALGEGNIQLNEPAKKNLLAVLSKHTTISEGIKKGRDVARASIKAKDAKITELTYRVNTLEAELEAEKATVKHMQWKAENGHESD